MRNAQSMSLKFKTSDVIIVITENRARHKENYEEALVKFKVAHLAELRKKISDLKKDKKVSLGSALLAPVSYLPDYDRALSMFRMTVETELELDQEQFNQLIRDEWVWSHNFASQTMSYVGK